MKREKKQPKNSEPSKPERRPTVNVDFGPKLVEELDTVVELLQDEYLGGRVNRSTVVRDAVLQFLENFWAEREELKVKVHPHVAKLIQDEEKGSSK